MREREREKRKDREGSLYLIWQKVVLIFVLTYNKCRSKRDQKRKCVFFSLSKNSSSLKSKVTIERNDQSKFATVLLWHLAVGLKTSDN